MVGLSCPGRAGARPGPRLVGADRERRGTHPDGLGRPARFRPPHVEPSGQRTASALGRPPWPGIRDPRAAIGQPGDTGASSRRSQPARRWSPTFTRRDHDRARRGPGDERRRLRAVRGIADGESAARRQRVKSVIDPAGRWGTTPCPGNDCHESTTGSPWKWRYLRGVR
jgi:hypothetical protein